MSEPVYDEDLVNLGYLKRIMDEFEENSLPDNISRNYGSRPNPPYNKGDTWIDGNTVYTCINTRTIGLYTDSDWVTESGARAEAERKNKIYLTQPSNYNPGDMWILQSDNDHIAGKKGEILITVAGRRTYSADDWINMIGYGSIKSINEAANNLNNAINAIENIESGLLTIFYTDIIPLEVQEGDLWYVTGEIQGYEQEKVYKYNGTIWELIDNDAIQKAFEDVNEERLVGDGKIQCFYSSITPENNLGAGDLWTDLGNDNQLYRYNGTNWVAVYDTKLVATEQDIETVTQRTATLETDLGSITGRVADTERILDVEKTVRLSEVIQMVDEISQRIQGFQDLTREKTDVTMLHLNNSVNGEGYILELQIKGEVPFLVPSNDLTPSNTLVPLGDHFKLVLDKQEKGNLSEDAQIIDIRLTQPLRKVSTIFDEVSIEKGNIYVIRRIGANNDGTLYIMGEPTKEFLGYVKLKTFENDTYIYLQEYTGTDLYCKYIIQSAYSDTFATIVEMNSAIEIKADEINEEVSQKVDEEEIIAKINAAIRDGQGIITIQGNQVIIDSDYFHLDAEGHIEATSGVIGGFDISSTSFSKDFYGLYDYTLYDLALTVCAVMEHISKTPSATTIYDYNNSGDITSLDFINILRVIQGTNENTKNVSGRLQINPNNPKNNLVITSNGTTCVSLGVGGINSENISSENVVSGKVNSHGAFEGIAINGEQGKITAIKYYYNGDEATPKQTIINGDGITTPLITQVSRAEDKKNFEKLENGLNIIKDTEIYKYNLKGQVDGEKKHIGFVIGDNFKYSHEITAENNGEEVGVDPYSMIAVAYKAIQEQQEQIEQLQKRIEELEEKINE